MKFTEKEKYIKNARKSVGGKYKYRQSDYTNWKIKDGYFFCLNSFALQKARLTVKTLYMDDLYWKITNIGGKDMMWKDGDRYYGVDGCLIWEEPIPRSLVSDFSEGHCEQVWEMVFRKSEQEIESFLQKYPHPDNFAQYVAQIENISPLTKMLVKIYEGKTDDAYRIAKECIDRGDKGGRAWSIPGEQGFKHEYEAFLDYCRPVGIEEDEAIVQNQPESVCVETPAMPSASPVADMQVQKTDKALKLTKAKLVKAVKPGLEKLGYVCLKDSITGSQGLFGKKLPNGMYLTLAMTIHRFYDDTFTADFELSRTASLFSMHNLQCRKRPGWLLTEEELAAMNETARDIWWNGLDAASVASFISVIQQTEPRFLGQEGLEEKIAQSTGEDIYLQRSLQIREYALNGVPDMDYEFLPTKCIDNIPMEWFKAAEYVLQERGEYLSLNPRMVKNVAGWAYRQYLLDNL